MPTATRTRMTLAAIEEMIERCVDEALEAYRNREPTRENGDGHGDDNGNDNGNCNRDKGENAARECTYQDFLKCQPLIFKGNKGVVGLTRSFEKMETVFHISNCPPKHQVKYALCTLHNDGLTWWNSHKRTVGTDVAYAMTWRAMMKLMTEVFQELVMLCTKKVPEEEDRVEKFIGGLPDNIQGNVIATESTRLSNAVRIANNLMDQKLKGYAARNNVARVYTVRNSERREYVRPLPYCNKYKLYHEGQCMVKCRNCKRVGHMTRDCRALVATITQGPLESNSKVVTCYECGRHDHYRSNSPKMKNQNRGNKSGNKPNKDRGRAYALGGGANPDSNVVTGTFLLNNHHARMLFDSGADRSFVSTTFSVLLDIIPSTLDISYVVELADGRIAEMNTLLRGCMSRPSTVVHPRVIIRFSCFTSSFTVMAIFAILISSDSSNESVGTSTSWVILFGKIPTSIPATVPIVDLLVFHDDTPLIPIETPTIPPVVSTLPYTSPFLYTDSSDSDILRDHHHRTRMRLLFLGGGAEYSESHSPSDHLSPDDFSSDTSSGSSSGYSPDTSSGHSIPDSSFDSPAASFAGPSHKRQRSPSVSVLLATPVPRALSLVRANLLLPRKRIRGSVSTNTQDDSA
ncbi:reverse transcriptase domain-containing protein [Tanacetum coccineum]